MHPPVRAVSRIFTLRLSRRWAHSFPQLNSVTEHDLAQFRKILPDSAIITTLPPNPSPESELEPFNNDWMNKYHGKSTTVLKPRSTKEVSEIVRWCNDRRIGIVPQGGNTGLVGGSVPVKDELILSLANMSKVRSFDDVSGACSPQYIVHTNLIQVTWRYFRHPGRRCRMHSPVVIRLSCPTQLHRAPRPGCERKVLSPSNCVKNRTT